MNFDEIQSSWKNQDSTSRIAVDEQVLRNIVERERVTLERTVFRRDMIEIVLSLIMIPIWVGLGVMMELPWTWYLTIPVLFWIAGYFIVNRRRQRRVQPRPGDTLSESVSASLAQVDHQIRLLSTVFWWYLLPPSITIGCFFIQVGWKSGSLWSAGFMLIAMTLVYWWIYELNQRAVRSDLEPRRQELRQFLKSIEEPNES